MSEGKQDKRGKSIFETQNEKEKQGFESFLDNGVDISSREDFSKLNENIKKYNLPYNLLNSNFDLISPNNKPFVLKKVNSGFNIYAKNDNFISRYFRRNSNVPRLVGIIDLNGKFENFVGNETYSENEYSSWEAFDNKIKLIGNETKRELEDLRRDFEEKANKDINYKVVKGDTLWKIVKEKYSVTTDRDIANTINVLVKYNSSLRNIRIDIEPEDRIRGDIIIRGKTIKLPHTLTILGKPVLRK